MIQIKDPEIKLPSFPKRKATWRFVVHCSATGPTQDIGAKEIDSWHRQRGFAAVGYHFVIRLDGTIERGRPVDSVGAHAAGYNSTSIGICLAGGVDADDRNLARDTFSDKQKAALAQLLDELWLDYPNAALYGHRDLDGVKKACPSFDVRKWWKGRVKNG